MKQIDEKNHYAYMRLSYLKQAYACCSPLFMTGLQTTAHQNRAHKEHSLILLRRDDGYIFSLVCLLGVRDEAMLTLAE